MGSRGRDGGNMNVWKGRGGRVRGGGREENINGWRGSLGRKGNHEWENEMNKDGKRMKRGKV